MKKIKEIPKYEKLKEEKSSLRKIETDLKKVRLSVNSIEEFRENFVKLKKREYPDLHDIIFSNLWFGDVLNTHSSPINGIRNFSRESYKPTCYKGWNGTIVIVLKKRPVGFCSNIIGYKTGVNTGSGGYRGDSYKGLENCYVTAYELRMYIDDFPIIKKQYEKLLEYENLYNRYINQLCIKEDKALKSDNVIIKLRKDKKSVEEEFNRIKSKLKDLTGKIFNRSEEIKKKVSDNFKFEFETEYNELKEKF